MKKIFNTIFVLCLLACAAPAYASFEDDFKNKIMAAGDAGVKAFAKDTGSLIGMSDITGGRAAPFPGFNIGVTANAIRRSEDNTIMRLADVDYMPMAFVYADAKLPFLGFSVAARGTSVMGFSSLGGGVKYEFFGSSLPLAPRLSGAAFYDKAGTEYFDINHFSASAKISIKVLVFEPYAGFGYDKSDFSVKNTTTPFDGKSYKTDGTRWTGGLTIAPLPFMYLFGAYTKTSAEYGLQAGLGVNF